MPQPAFLDDQQNATLVLGVRAALLPDLAGDSDSASPVEGLARAAHSTICRADLLRDDLSGLTLGPYALGKKLGGGGMGTIFAARHVHLERDFAIKFIASAAANCPEARSRFEQEVKALGKLQHSNIVSAIDAGCVGGLQYLATERIFGEDLSQIVQRRGALAYAEACELVRQTAIGLAHAHACGILHRDIKPSNLILDRTGVVKILDFGLVRNANSALQLTTDGALLGTLDFLSPEQAQDPRSVDPRSDLYSLGCTLLYLVSGQPPFSDDRYATPAATIKGHLLDTPAWLNHVPAGFPAPLAAIIRRLLAKTPEQRVQSAAELAELLGPWSQGIQVAQLLDHSSAASITPVTWPTASGLQTWRTKAFWRRGGFIGGTVAIVSTALLAFAPLAYWRGALLPETPGRSATVTATSASGVSNANTKMPNDSAAHVSVSAATPAAASAPRPAAAVTSEPKQTTNAPTVKFAFPAASSKSAFRPLSGDASEADRGAAHSSQ